MAKNSKRRRVSGNTPQGEPISVPGVSANGCANSAARAKGCFGKSTGEKNYVQTLALPKKKKRKVGKK